MGEEREVTRVGDGTENRTEGEVMRGGNGTSG